MSLLLTSSEVQKHNNRKSLWIVIKNDVYDVTSYLSEHPGGEDPLLDAAGQDATRAFEDVGHSADARSLLKKYKIGSLMPGESCSRLRPRKWMSSSASTAAAYTCSLEEKPKRKVEVRSRSSPKNSVSKSTLSSKRSVSLPLSPSCSEYKSPHTPAVIVPRVGPIVVPRRGGVCRKPPRPRGSKLKWALLALAAAVIIGVAYKKYAT